MLNGMKVKNELEGMRKRAVARIVTELAWGCKETHEASVRIFPDRVLNQRSPNKEH
jgi:hypothetical protein